MISILHKSIKLLMDFISYNYRVFKIRKKTSILRRNLKLKDKYNGRVFILGTGNSVSKHDLSGLIDEYTIGVNRFFLKPEYSKLNIDFFTLIENWSYHNLSGLSWIVDVCFTKSKKSMITFLSSSGFEHINNSKQYDYRSVSNFFEKDNIYYVTSNNSFKNADDINIDISSPCNILNGSLYFSIGLAIYLGFDKIYLLGMDYTKTPLSVGNFFDGLNENWAPEDVNTDSHPTLYNDTLNKQNSINNFALDRGVQILNVTEEGKTSEIFKSVLFDDIKLKHNKPYID